jgi:DNA topoisomerase-2
MRKSDSLRLLQEQSFHVFRGVSIRPGNIYYPFRPFSLRLNQPKSLKLLGTTYFSSQSEITNAEVEETYQRMSPREHVLRRPEPYIGSTTCETVSAVLFDVKSCKFSRKEVQLPPALIQILDEILVNACDNQHRSPESVSGKKSKLPKMSKILIEFNIDSGTVCVENDGAGIPVALHDTEKIYVPELIFGHLLTSSNYDDTRERLTGGRHGYGAKLTNIFSTRFSVEIGDAQRGLWYRQTFRANMSEVDPPIIRPLSESGRSLKNNFTRLEFLPDLARFGRRHNDIIIIIYTIDQGCALSPPTSKVSSRGNK